MKELINYGVFGVATTVVNWLVYSFFVKNFSVDLNVANMIAWLMAVLFAFVVNKLFVFQSKSWRKDITCKEFTLFIGARIFSGIFEILGLPFLLWLGVQQSLLGVEGLVAKIIISVLVIVLNYVFSKFVVFN